MLDARQRFNDQNDSVYLPKMSMYMGLWLAQYPNVPWNLHDDNIIPGSYMKLDLDTPTTRSAGASQHSQNQVVLACIEGAGYKEYLLAIYFLVNILRNALKTLSYSSSKTPLWCLLCLAIQSSVGEFLL